MIILNKRKKVNKMKKCKIILLLLCPSVLTVEINQSRTSILEIDLRYQSLGLISQESNIIDL